MKKYHKLYRKISLSPAYLLVTIILSIFAAEILVTFCLSILSIPFTVSSMFLDAGFLAIILFPLIYYFVVKPFAAQIEELKQSEEAALASEERYRSLVESTADSIYLVDRNYKYLFMNKRHMTRMGFSGSEYVGHCFSEFHSDRETMDFIEKVDIVFERGKPLWCGHRSERDDRFFLRTFSPVHNPNGEVAAVSVVSKRITLGRGGRLQERN